MSPRGLSLCRIALLSCAFGFPFVLMQGKSISGDEIAHIPAGYSYLRTREIVLNPMHPPLIKEICALPLLFLNLGMPVDAAAIRSIGKDFTYQWEFGQQFLAENGNLERLLFWARAPAALLSLALAILVMTWASELWGPAGGVLALFLCTFDPTITAHAELVTTDVGFALFATLFFYLLWRFSVAPSAARLSLSGISLGLALGAKFSAVSLIPLAAALLAVNAWVGPPDARAARLLRAALGFGVVLLIAYLVVWAIYFFPSDPRFYLAGIGDVKGDYNPGYLHFLMGQFQTGRWLSYFLIAWLVKMPLPALLLCAAAIVALAAGIRRDWRAEAFVAVPAVGLFLGYSLLADPIGVRYVLPCFPFLFVFTGRLGLLLGRGKRTAALAVSSLLAWSITEFVAIWPDHLSYFNQIAGGWRGGIAWLDDSNVDWGQNYTELREYLAQHPRDDYRLCNFGDFNPRYYGFAGQLVWLDKLLEPPAPGVLILSSHCVARVRSWLENQHGDGPQNWFAHVRPIAVVGHTYYVYEIPDPAANARRAPGMLRSRAPGEP